MNKIFSLLFFISLLWLNIIDINAINSDVNKVDDIIGLNILSTPDLTLSKSSNSDITLTWEMVDNAKGYEIYRKSSKEDNYQLIKAITGLSFLDVNVNDRINYYYIKAIAKNDTFTDSQLSNIVDNNECIFYQMKLPLFIDQVKNGAPNGCEAASLLMALKYKNYAIDITYQDFMNQMPKHATNPKLGFIHSMYKKSDKNTVNWIDAQPLSQYGANYGNVENISGVTIEQLINEILLGNPIVVYTTYKYKDPYWLNKDYGQVYGNLHVVLLDGYDASNKLVHISDPILGSNWLDITQFVVTYNGMKRAVVIR